MSGAATMSASASDDVGVAGVQFQLDGLDVGAEDTAAPFSLTWNTTTTTNGPHTVTAVARDAAGNRTTSAEVGVFVNNATNSEPVVMSRRRRPDRLSVALPRSARAPQTTWVSRGSVRIDGINLGAEDTTAPYGVSWTTTSVASGTHMVTAEARDSAGNRTTSAAISVSVNNTSSDSAPSVSIMAPASGQTVSGTANLARISL